MEDFVSTILGNLAGFNADKDLVEAMTAAKLPDERLNNKKLVMGLLSSFDESFGEYLSSIKGLDPASQRLVMQRQTGYAFSGEIEKVVESKLKGYGVLKADQSFPKLDFRAALEKK